MSEAGATGGAERAFRSIGEVLELLTDEFPDVTISKIRFLESQGLLDPERTPSGYRKFYDDDVERLRWILRQQRENFLPLKVIKGRLDQAKGPVPTQPAEVGVPSEPAAGADPAVATEPAVDIDPLEDSARPGSYTMEELARTVGLAVDDVADLARYGLIEARPVGGSDYYDADAVETATLAAGFMKHGVEARHLKLYKNGAEREAGFFEQLVLPMLKHTDPDARREAVQTLRELARLGARLRAVQLRRALADYLEVR